ncbi:winged helix-turn-helix transcriptional regulator [Aquibacillus koreensis]|uniref:Winged helix-turn-helix transcriptional regulator n=1 Tax=Aquibacillus koreensis TaxID=279446 RepID=A0A9X3WLN2_9BACI|nr:winged helix-turn-helix transcriptional regulator [Aquibacillus koreensis]MCT2536481.1 winged helix-turn-helix transcriptional regulator [Aquibacillus koreensis]MDC3419431.1 winged helix-turn-helix transcriptional regulator [Aquibacillus koreensis]
MKTTYNLPCNIAQSLNIIGDRWTLLIAHEILKGNVTFSDIKKALDGISSNILSDRLKYLEQCGLVTSELYSDHPPRYHYQLTDSGKDLEHVFHAILLWGRDHLQTCYKKLVHTECQHEVTIAYYCPHCETNVDQLSVVEVDEEKISS